MINTVWQSFLGFLIAFVIKRLLHIKIRVFIKKKKEEKKRETGGAKRPEWATAHFQVSVVTKNSLSR